ncbi:hypothetical protein K432DRAFT_442839 [Lepidopterella palustris CBS 459.81]|uniref:GAR domain-containing protein n=1 Tax=Lepidopterella palustris CBS 459.81 TaxID=1314670 RepID=A0A8E2EC50_9PEZI|nr:hypothetical protein K432DRAFT_442839 [Lepidopterella palustris CBS 459.81]
MAHPSSPTRFSPPSYPSRANSPSMSPRRHGRMNQSSDDSHLRDLSPTTTLRAFTETPVSYTNTNEYKIFSCIESATPAEKDLGTRVAKAAQRLKSWCKEIEQWGWTGSFEPPGEECREERRKSVEGHINYHMKGDSTGSGSIGPLEYWGSLLSVQVEAYEGRIEEIEQELESLDMEELKGHILDIHGPNRSRPSSSYDTRRPNFTLLDDFSILITHTLLQALPYLSQLRLNTDTWSSRLSILRECPRFLGDLDRAQIAMRLGWEAIEPPSEENLSDTALNSWKEAIATISEVLESKVADLGQRLDRMLDTLEGREDTLPEDWIDEFEALEANYSQWTVEARNRILEVEVRRMRASQKVSPPLLKERHLSVHETTAQHSEKHSQDLIDPAGGNLLPNIRVPEIEQRSSIIDAPGETSDHLSYVEQLPTFDGQHDGPYRATPQSPTALRLEIPESADPVSIPEETLLPEMASEEGDIIPGSDFLNEGIDEDLAIQDEGEASIGLVRPNLTIIKRASVTSIESFSRAQVRSINVRRSSSASSSVSSPMRDPSNSIRDYSSSTPASPINSDRSDLLPQTKFSSPLAVAPAKARPPEIPRSGPDRPQTPESRFRRDSIDSVSSSISQMSSPQSTIEDSPSFRTTATRSAKVPRPPLNSVMAKRRPLKDLQSSSPEPAKQPWPPTKFAQQPPTNSTDDLERQISNILTTIPAHIRLTSGPEADSPEIKPNRVASSGTANGRGYHATSLRAARASGGVKSPELTLSPVKHDIDASSSQEKGGAAFRRAAAQADSDIKLYHLTQAGKDKPIKLFVRRVGENGERVMVRVGGGWADLGEYLRQYAEHHGRRTVSEGKFEVLGLEAGMKGGEGRDGMARAGTPRPGSSASRKEFTATPLGTPGDRHQHQHHHHHHQNQHPTPSSALGTPAAGVGAESAPSTTSSHVSWTGTEVGLAGPYPKAKKMDLTSDKLEWIEGMMNQARKVSGHVGPGAGKAAAGESGLGVEKTEGGVEKNGSGEGRVGANSRVGDRSGASSRAGERGGAGSRAGERVRGGNGKGFGDLGKVGGTKRVFLKRTGDLGVE